MGIEFRRKFAAPVMVLKSATVVEQWESRTHIINKGGPNPEMFTFTSKSNHMFGFALNCGRNYVEDNFDQRSERFVWEKTYYPGEVVLRRKASIEQEE